MTAQPARGRIDAVIKELDLDLTRIPLDDPAEFWADSFARSEIECAILKCAGKKIRVTIALLQAECDKKNCENPPTKLFGHCGKPCRGSAPVGCFLLSPPGDTIRDIMEERGISDLRLGILLEISDGTMEDLLSGQTPITADIARKLSNVLGSTQEFWENREKQYREVIALLQAGRK